MNPIDLYAEDPRTWLTQHELWAGGRKYDDEAKAFLARSGHYLDDPPPGAFMAIGVERLVPGLFGVVPSGALVGLAVLGRPIARNLDQKGAWAELTRVALVPELPHQTASHVLRVMAEVWFDWEKRPHATTILSYHDRTRHSGCIYKKAGFRKYGTTRKDGRRGTWASRPGREQSAEAEVANKRRWRLDVDVVRKGLAIRRARAMGWAT